MEQQVLTETDVQLDVYSVEQPIVAITEPITTELVTVEKDSDTKVITEESAVLLVLTEGGSLYRTSGYSGTELEWMTELLDSKASVQFVVTTFADGQSAYASALLALKAEVGSTYATNTHLFEVLAQRDLARALDYQNLTAQISSSVQASYTELLDVLASNNLVYSQSITNLTAQLGSLGSRVNNVEIAIVTEGQARAASISNLTSTLNGRITSEINTVLETIVTNQSATATQLLNLSTSFNNRFDAELSIINTAISTETSARASQIETLRVDFIGGLSATLTEIDEVKIDINGNASAISSLSGVVTNPTTGLSAAFNRANQAYTLADNTAGSLSVIEGKVNNATTGLAATYAFAQQVEINAATNTTTAINSLRNEITAPSAGWTANNTFIQSINTKAGNALTDAAAAQNKADTAFTNAQTANTELAAISSDSVLSKGEKPAVVLNLTNILNEQAGITAEGVRYGITTKRTAYTAAITALTTYLNALTPAYTDTTTNTPIVGTTFKTKFADVYTARQGLLDAIAAAAKVLADNAQGTANNALNLVTTLSNNLQNTVNGYIASNALVLSIQDDLEGNMEATTTLTSSVEDLDAWKTDTASVQLLSHTNAIGELESRAFFGVTSTVGGKATVAGITVNSVDYGIRFQGNIFELTNTSGVQQLYYDSAVNQWKFNGGLVIGGYPINSVSDIRGLDAKALRLSSTAQAFKYNSLGALQSASSIVFTATSSNLAGSPVFTTTPSVTLSGTGNTRTLTAVAFGVNTSVKVTVTMDGLTDEITVVRLQDGVNGENALSAYLTNESHTVTTNSDGSGGLYSTAGGQIKVFSGVTAVTAGVTYSVTNVTSGLSISVNSSGVYTVTGCTVDNAVATIRAVVSGVTIDKVYSLSKSKQGSTGTAGEKGKAFSAAQFFNFKSNSTDGFTFTGLTRTTTATHLNISGFNSDPQLLRDCDVNGSLYPLIVIRMRNNTASAINNNWQMFYSTSSHGYSESYSKTQLVNLPADGQWYDVVFDMSVLTSGGSDYITNAIRNMRIDPPPNAAYSIDIESIFLGKEGAAIDGKLGAGFYGGVYSSIDWTTNTANNRFFDLIGRMPIKFDIFTQSRSDNTDSQSRQYNGSSWDPAALQVNGSIIALGTIAGNKIIAGTEISSPILTGGRLRTAASGSRTEIHDDGTYLIWTGDGVKNDVNGTFWVKKNGTGFIKGAFFQGQIIESRYGNSNTTTGALTANALGHNSEGKPKEITGTGSTRARTTGGNYSNSGPFQAVGTLYRNGVVIGSVTSQTVGIYNMDTNWTEWFLNYTITAIDTLGVGTYDYTYDIIFTPPSLPNLTYISRSVTLKTFENKLG